MIAGIPLARCHEARWHGTSATATARKQTPYLHQLPVNGEILQSISNTPYLGVTLSTDLKFNIHLNKNVAKSYQCLAFVRRNLNYILSGEIATSIIHFSDTI